ncbi:phosphoethanolamine transferase EptA [Enterobacteriaceae bacterium 4M9]|nr:phosphoethanolamine transferase EptA [Enterobacteriaceae bacterium 4M9]
MRLPIKLRCNDMQFNLLCATLFTLVNALFIERSWRVIGMQTPREWVFAASVPVVLFSAWLIIFSTINLPLLRKPLAMLLIIGCAAANYFMYSYGVVIDTNMMVNVFETNQQEAMALVTPKLVMWLILGGVVPALLIAAITITPAKWWYSLLVRGLSVLGAIVLILLIASVFYKDYASLFRNTNGIAKLVTPPNYISAIGNYSKDRWFSGDKTLTRIGEDAQKGPLLTQSAKKTVVVLVVGETSRAQNYSLGGYARETNPQLKKQDVVWFNNATSCGTETAVSVPCMFSNMTRENYSANTARYTEGVLDVLKHAGINVLWRENDGGCKGACNRVNFTDMTRWQLKDMCKNGSCLDDAELYRLDNVLDGLQRDSVIVLHIMGSHGPAYYQRYPAQFRRFTPTCDTNQIEDCDRQSLMNTYDNTILYTDNIVSRTIDKLRARQGQMNTALVYLSDHGESLGESGMYLHGTPRMLAPQEQIRIPFLFWLSDGYANQFSLDKTCMKKEAASREISQDNLFDTLLGMMDIKTKVYRPKLDLTQPCRAA